MAKGSGNNRTVSSTTATTSRTSTTSTSSSMQSARLKKEPKIPLNQISTETLDYRWTHGHEPRGRGDWYFSIGSKEAYDDIRKAFRYYGYYRYALEEAKKEAQKRGETRVYVMS